MSSILKALKKLEEEKSLLQEERKINVSKEILKQPAERRINVRWLWLLGSSATAVIILLTFALIRKSSTKDDPNSRMTPIASLPATSLSPAPVVLTPPILKGSDNSVRITPTSSLKGFEPAPLQRTPPLAAERSMGGKELPNTPMTVTEPLKAEPVKKSASTSTAVSNESTLTLSGIAWNKDSADRLAIINGQPTATGATINGAVVDEILPDRVKLSHSGRTIELLIGKTARTD